MPPSFLWRPEVLGRLEELGIRPLPHSDPLMVRDYLKALYTMEVRFLRSDQRTRERGGDLESRKSYAGRVIALREHYEILALPVELWADRIAP
ncbi:MAG: hypothetical protein LC732_06645 [Acidobacteria bacterium]|nr:hypothetical protein [Acidobacteriota bacterium]